MAVTSPPTEHPPVNLPSIALAEPRRQGLTLEQLLYLAIGVLAVLSHLYLLGARALHHDETLHAAYSWRIYQGQGYTHDPLLHGPFLYYITALQYLIFGDSDFTARLSAALFGIALTMLPLLLRRDIGRGAALLACGYLLISPVSLYVGRFIRHDIYAVVFELLAVIAIVRYVATERPVWHYVLAAAMGLMLVTLETFFLFLAIVGSFVVVWTICQVAAQRGADRRLLWSVGGLTAAYAIFAGVALKIVPRWAGPLPLPTPEQALQVRNQPNNDFADYFGKVGGVLGPMLRHPSILLLLLSTLVVLGALIALLFVSKGADGRSAWRRAADNAPRGSLIGALDRIPARQWAIAMGIAFAIYAVFFTAILSNPSQPNTAGLITGVAGSLLYWLGQHGVQRGNQPPHFYLFLLSVYEPLLCLLAPIGLVHVLTRLWPGRRRDAAAQPATSRSGVLIGRLALAPALLAWWSLGALLVYSWAGEKMPWLTIHIVLPLTLLSAWSLARLWSWASEERSFDTLALGLTAATGLLLLLCFNKLSTTVADRATAGATVVWPLLMISFLVLLALGMIALYRSARPAVLALLSLALALGVFFTVRSNIRLVFVNGDVPVEPLVFVQTSPDVPHQIANLRAASLLRTGKLDLPIRYDNETIWDWYLRNYSESQGSGGTQIGPVDERVQAIFMLTENVAANEQDLDGFVRQQYPLRWWFPECDVYRLPGRDSSCGFDAGKTSLLSAVLSRPWDGQALAAYWQFWFDRKLPNGLGSTDWTLLVRPELAAEFEIGAGQQP